MVVQLACVAGYGNVPDAVGQSNADHPVLTPWLYTPSAPPGARFTTGFATTKIARLYHSSASLLPDGSVLVAGSNPNLDVTTTKYATEYRIEYFRPPYYFMTRPSFTGTPQLVDYGVKFTVKVSNPGNAVHFKAVIMDLGFHTHAVSLDSRYVGLVSVYHAATHKLTITGPPNANIYPPGPAFLYILGDGIPSNGTKLIIGTGADPAWSATAYEGARSYSQTLQSNSWYRNATNYIPPYVPNYKNKKGKDRDGKDRDGKDRDGKDRDGKDRDGKDRDGKDRDGKDRDDKDRD